jgi:protein-S-isoprenylcysteine O-methyltransferase Ste14
MTHADSNRPDVRGNATAGVIAPPPVLFGAALLIALLLHELHPLPIAPPSGWPRLLGIPAIVLGLLLSGWVIRAFGRAATPVPPYRPTRRLVVDGPYRYTRNPDYVGQTLTYLGIALVARSGWALLILPLVLVAVQHGVVRREERYLETRFGQPYRDYMARVRRWL